MSFWGGAGPPSKLVNMLVKWRPCQGPYEEKHAMKHAIDDFLRLRASSTSVVAPMTPRSHARSTMRWVCGVMAMQHSTQNVGRCRCWFLSSAGSARQSPIRLVLGPALYQGPSHSKSRIDRAVRYHSSFVVLSRHDLFISINLCALVAYSFEPGCTQVARSVTLILRSVRVRKTRSVDKTGKPMAIHERVV